MARITGSSSWHQNQNTTTTTTTNSSTARTIFSIWFSVKHPQSPDPSDAPRVACRPSKVFLASAQTFTFLRAVTDLCDENKTSSTRWRQLRGRSDGDFREAVAKANELHPTGDLFRETDRTRGGSRRPCVMGHGRGVRRRIRRAHA